MKTLLFLCVLLVAYCFLSCNKRSGARIPVPDASSADVMANSEAPMPSKYESMEVLPGDKEAFSRPVEPGQMPRTLIHDSPLMDRLSWGNYSYIGAVKAFKSICGFNPPDWVEPLSGTFSVSTRRSGSVMQSLLEFKIDPARRSELEKLIVEANAREFPQRWPVIFHSDPNLPASSGAYIDFKANGKEKESMAVRIDEKGAVTLRASRGPLGWDE